MERESRSGRARLWAGIALALVYAVPCFAPPVPAALGMPTPPDAWLLARIFPGVPALWVGLRLTALAGAAVLLAARPFDVLPPAVPDAARATVGLRVAAVALALAHLAASGFARGLGPAGQVGYLAALALPALVLALGERAAAGTAGARWSWRALAPTAAVVAVWVAARLVTDLGSPRTADVIDGWRGFLDTFRLATEKENLLTTLYDPRLPGVSAVFAVLQGVPFFQTGLVPFGMSALQAFQIAAVAATAVLLARLADRLVGAGSAALVAAVFLFAPFTRFMAFFPGPFLAAPLYAVLVALAALAAVRRRSEAAVAALGAAAGLAVGYPSVAPLLGVVGAWTLWHLRRDLGRLGAGIGAGLASCAAMVVPAVPDVLSLGRFGSHFRWDGSIAVIDAGLLGQLPLATTPPAFEGVVARPLDVVASALLAPFANPRVAIRLWGDCLLDPVGAVLLAIGLVACAHAWRRAWPARALLVAYFVALAPAFVSPVDVANVTYAAALPVVVALAAAAGLAALPLSARGRRATAAGATIAVVVGGSLVFDVVNRQVLPASSFGTMFDTTAPAALARVVVLGYGPGFVRPTKTLYTGPITAFAGRVPVGYFAWDAGALPVEALAAEGKDLLFWSHGYERDVPIAAAVCAAWPHATLYEIADRSGLARVHAARVGEAPWEPAAPPARWRARRCGE